MVRIALVSSEPIRSRMAGIGIRFNEFARRLPEHGIQTTLLSPGKSETAFECGVPVQRVERGRLAEALAGFDAAVVQGHLANHVLLEAASIPTVVDLYDPWLVENLSYAKSLGLDTFRSDHASWVLQLSRGDFFICSSAEQRLFYLGFLTALGRVNPRRAEADPTLETLISTVPFGVPAQLPEHRPWLPPRAEGEERLLFGGLYDWYRPLPLLEALAKMGRERCRLYFVRSPNPESTPQRALAEVETWCRGRPGWWGDRVQLIDWVPHARRFDLLRDVDLAVVTHTAGLETDLAMRTRLIEALAAGCPVVTTAGGTTSRLIEEWNAGWVADRTDPDSIASCLTEALDDPAARSLRGQQGLARVVEHHRWDRVLEPLIQFCQRPRRDPTRFDFSYRPETVSPADPLAFRAKRWLRARFSSSRGVR